MTILSNNLSSASWSTDAPQTTDHYYACGCAECAAAMVNLKKHVVVTDAADAPIVHAEAAALPYYASALLYPADWRWNADQAHGTAVTVTYSFMTSNPGQYGGFRAFNDTEKAAARESLADWAKVCNVTFKEVSSGGQIAFGNADVGGASGMTLWQGMSASQGMKTTHADVYMSSTQSLTYTDGSFGYRAILHEVGHALGLKHTFDTSGTTLSGVENTAQYSVMSYDNPPSTPNSQPFTPQLYDIAAAQYLYGANKAANAGDTVYQWSNTKAQVMTIWDGGGFDTMDGSNQSLNLTLDMREGKFSNVGVYNNALANNTVAVAFGTVIEKAVGGSGADTIVGNDAANVLVGGGGADKLTGNGGADAFCYASAAQGGDTIADFVSGTDHFEFDAQAFGIAAGVLSSGSFATVSGTYGGSSAASFVFDSSGNLWFDSNGSATGGATKMATLSSGSVTASDIHLVGDFTAPPSSGGGTTTDPGTGTGGTTDPVPTSVTGTSGNDTLSGVGGDVTMTGGLGNDTYIVDSMGDKVVEYSSQGVDTVQSALSYTLGAYEENLTLTGTANVNGTGSAWHNLMIGNSGANVLQGMAGNDTIRGWEGNDQITGGAGQDVLTGGLGIDTFRYLSTGDVSYKATNGTKGTLKGDTITDFIAAKDKLWFDDASFALAQGNAVNGVNFAKIGVAYDGTNASATDYNAGKGALILDSTGTLYYDANGKGAGYHVVATIQSGGTINASDIVIA